MFWVLYLVCFVLLGPGALASWFRRTDPNSILANAAAALNPLNPLNVQLKDDSKKVLLRCEAHDDCGWAEYCGWHPTTFKPKDMAARCQACVGCVEPEINRFLAFGMPLAPVTGKCPNCDERARVGKQSKLPPQKIVTPVTPKVVDADFEKLEKQKQALERELDHVKGSIYDINVNHEAKEQKMEDEILALRKNMQTQKVASTRTTTTTRTTTRAQTSTPGVAGATYDTYNTYNIYNTYNTKHTYNSNGHTFNSWSSCENASQPMPMGVTQAPTAATQAPKTATQEPTSRFVRVILAQERKAASASLLRLRRQPVGLPSLPPVLDLNCTGVEVD